MNTDFKEQAEKLLGDRDPSPFTFIEGDSPLVFTYPHNGLAVPKLLDPYMGMGEDWFSRAHESHDLYMSDLAEKLRETFPKAHVLIGNYSRLVVDLNAKPDFAITVNSSEYTDKPIIGNCSENMPGNHCTRRMQEIYDPYHDFKKTMIEKVREKNNGKALVLDMHSFSPKWYCSKAKTPQPRREEIGTIRCEKTPLSYAAEEFLRKQDQYNFISGKPYRVAERPSNAAPDITLKNNVQYLGLETRHDLIADQDGIGRIASVMRDLIDHLRTHPNAAKIYAKRSDIIADIKNPVTAEEAYDTLIF